jgi:hypothetical protein
MQAAVAPLLVYEKGGGTMTPYEITCLILGIMTFGLLAVKVTIHLVEFLLKAKIDRPSN